MRILETPEPGLGGPDGSHSRHTLIMKQLTRLTVNIEGGSLYRSTHRSEVSPKLF